MIALMWSLVLKVVRALARAAGLYVNLISKGRCILTKMWLYRVGTIEKFAKWKADVTQSLAQDKKNVQELGEDNSFRALWQLVNY